MRIIIPLAFLAWECAVGAALSQTVGYTSIKSEIIKPDSSVSTEERVYPIKVLLPKEIVRSISADGQLPSPATNKLILDVRYGAFYRLIQTKRGITTIVEGLLDRGRTPEQCDALGQREVIYGVNEPRERGGEGNLEADAPSRQFTFAIGCTNYMITVQCSREGEAVACQQALQNLQTVRDWRRVLAITRAIRNDMYRGAATRPSPKAIIGAVGNLPQKSSFSYVEPGILHGRQYLAPGKCGDLAVAEQFYADVRTEYSRMVFAGPDVLKRFPIDLKASDKAVANSQIFAPGGGFLLNHSNAARLLPQGARRHGSNFAMTVDDYRKKMRCENDILFDQDDHGNPRLGVPGNPKWYADSSNFLYPWSDTFCEFRGRPGTAYFFCGAKGRLVEGIHYGTDVRGQTQDPQSRTPVIAVTDGSIIEVDKSCRKGKKMECDADAQSPYWDIGHTVKLRSTYDPRVTFVYRHMNPDWSPFANANGRALKEGDVVNAGQIIGYMHGYLNGTPLGTSKHLHFEIEFAPPPDLLNRCTRVKGGQTVQLCSTPVKAPPYPSLLVAYLRERYGYQVDLSQKDPMIGLAMLPRLPNEITVHELRTNGYTLKKLAPLVSQ